MRRTAILDNTSDFVSTAALDKQLTYINTAGRKLIGLENDESLEDKRIHDVHPKWAMDIIALESLLLFHPSQITPIAPDTQQANPNKLHPPPKPELFKITMLAANRLANKITATIKCKFLNDLKLSTLLFKHFFIFQSSAKGGYHTYRLLQLGASCSSIASS